MSETHIRIARFSVNIPSERSLSFVEAKILGKLQVFECVSLSLSLSSWVSKCGEFWSLPCRNRTKETGLLICTPVSSTFVESFGQALSRVTRIWFAVMNTKRGVFPCTYIYIYIHVCSQIRSWKKKKKREERKKKSIRQRRERENNGVNEPWTTSTRNSRNGRSTAVFGIPLRIWRVQKYQGHFCPRRNESEAYVNLYAYVLSMRKLNRVNQGREELESIEFLEFDFV